MNNKKRQDIKKSVLRIVWRHTPTLPRTAAQVRAHELRRSRILERIAQSQQIRTLPFWKQARFQAAASIAVLFSALVYFIGYQSTPKIDQYHIVTSAISRSITLPDSSIVTLEPYSSLSWQQTGDQFDRLVSLVGEARFEVTRKMKQTFTVKGTHLSVQVLGTVFTVRDIRGSKDQKVHVDEGKVAVSLNNTTGNKPYTLVAGQELVHTENKTQISAIRQVNTNNKQKKHIKLLASNLEQLGIQLAEAYRIEVHVTPGIRQNGALTAEFKDMDLDQILALVSKTIKINYRIETNKVYITPK
ncbi:FecR family protein [Sphingobacterium sp. xlx-130]|uniref:FecR family protein n=1 Tax=Sphingobacterium sp. xlx-130 TaxID=2654323 RepID=UPI0013D9A8E7|nr:FecR family protein [Sphingobacterium sp. xlx-130]